MSFANDREARTRTGVKILMPKTKNICYETVADVFFEHYGPGALRYLSALKEHIYHFVEAQTYESCLGLLAKMKAHCKNHEDGKRKNLAYYLSHGEALELPILDMEKKSPKCIYRYSQEEVEDESMDVEAVEEKVEEEDIIVLHYEPVVMEFIEEDRPDITHFEEFVEKDLECKRIRIEEKISTEYANDKAMNILEWTRTIRAWGRESYMIPPLSRGVYNNHQKYYIDNDDRLSKKQKAAEKKQRCISYSGGFTMSKYSETKEEDLPEGIETKEEKFEYHKERAVLYIKYVMQCRREVNRITGNVFPQELSSSAFYNNVSLSYSTFDMDTINLIEKYKITSKDTDLFHPLLYDNSFSMHLNLRRNYRRTATALKNFLALMGEIDMNNVMQYRIDNVETLEADIVRFDLRPKMTYKDYRKFVVLEDRGILRVKPITTIVLDSEDEREEIRDWDREDYPDHEIPFEEQLESKLNAAE